MFEGGRCLVFVSASLLFQQNCRALGLGKSGAVGVVVLRGCGVASVLWLRVADDSGSYSLSCFRPLGFRLDFNGFKSDFGAKVLKVR